MQNAIKAAASQVGGTPHHFATKLTGSANSSPRTAVSKIKRAHDMMDLILIACLADLALTVGRALLDGGSVG